MYEEKISGLTQNYEGGKIKYRDATQNYGKKSIIIGMQLRIMGEKSKYRDANSELWGKR